MIESRIAGRLRNVYIGHVDRADTQKWEGAPVCPEFSAGCSYCNLASTTDHVWVDNMIGLLETQGNFRSTVRV